MFFFPLFVFLNIEEVAVWTRRGKEQAAKRRSDLTRASTSSGLINDCYSVVSVFLFHDGHFSIG